MHIHSKIISKGQMSTSHCLLNKSITGSGIFWWRRKIILWHIVHPTYFVMWCDVMCWLLHVVCFCFILIWFTLLGYVPACSLRKKPNFAKQVHPSLGASIFLLQLAIMDKFCKTSTPGPGCINSSPTASHYGCFGMEMLMFLKGKHLLHNFNSIH